MNARQRRICSRMLLALFVSMVVCSCLHVHTPSGASSQPTSSSTHQLPGTMAGGGQACVLCHFLSTPYLGATAITWNILMTVLWTVCTPKTAHVARLRKETAKLRAPPCL